MPSIRHLRPYWFVLLALLAMLLPLSPTVAQEDDMSAGEPAHIEIHGINPLELPNLYVTVSVTDSFGRTVRDLRLEDFALFGEIAELGRLINVENITNDDLSYAVVLALDTSSSMQGTPIRALKEAANTFVDVIGENAPVALLAFDSTTQIIQEFTTDKDTLRASINALSAGGRTALYQAGYDAVELAARAPTPRRAVIILSDGHEYGGVSTAGREDARIAAKNRGVPVYTIGLGYDEFDRDYLQELSAAGYGIFSESPSPDELEARYSEFAALFRSQYILTIEADLPLNGSIYSLGVALKTETGRIDSTQAIVRSPIPVPYITTLLEPPSAPIEEPTIFSFNVAADDELQDVSIALDGEQITAEVVDEKYSAAVDPVELAPGPHKMTIAARDVDGDSAGLTVPFDVAALPPEITVISSLLEQPVLRDPVEVLVEVGGQTPFATAEIVLDGVSEASLEEDITVRLDPYEFNEGPHELEFIITNEAEQSASERVSFEVPPLPPLFRVEGLEDGDFLEEIANVDLGIIATQVGGDIERRYRLNTGPELSAAEGITLNPRDLQPGPNTITITVEDRATSLVSEASIDFEVAALNPEAAVGGLASGDILSEDRRINVDVDSQTEVLRVVTRLDGVEIERLIEAPYEIDLEVLDIPPGEHTLEIQVINDGLREDTTTIEFTVPEEPARIATATVIAATARAAASATAMEQAIATATGQAIATVTQEARVAATEIMRATATQQARVTATGQAIATVTQEARVAATEIVRATAVQEARDRARDIVRATATEQAVASATQQAIVTATEQAIATATGQAIATVTQEARVAATEIVRATAVQEARDRARDIVRATATEQAVATATEQAIATATEQAIATATEQAVATATQEARATATEIVRATATQEARATATEVVRATATQEARATATEVVRATATQEARATATEVVRATATQEARATATEIIRATATQEARATATEIVRATATQEARATATQEARAKATEIVRATATEEARATATEIVRATATEEARATATEIVRATATQEARATATEVVRATATEQAIASATQRVIATATQEARATATEIVRVTATQEARATATEIVRATATQEARATATEIVRATATQEARATATEIVRATATEQAIASATQRVIATATQEARATATEIVRATATQEARATATEQAIATATERAIATATEQAIASATQRVIATATQEARATATEIVRATATQEARATATQEWRATAVQAARQAAREIVRATATQRAIVMATEQAIASATQRAIAAATEQAIVSATQRAIAAATEQAIASATQRAIAAATEQAIVAATEQAIASATEQAIAVTTEQAIATQTEAAIPSATSALDTTDLPVQPLSPSETADAFDLPAVSTATEAGEATDIAPNETPTATPIPPSETPAPTATTIPSTATLIAPSGTPAPTATLIPVDLTPPAEPADNTPLLVASIVVLLALSVAFYLLRGRRQAR